MQQKINAIFTKRILELNDSLRFNDSLTSCNRAQNDKYLNAFGGILKLINPSLSFEMKGFVHGETNVCRTNRIFD